MLRHNLNSDIAFLKHHQINIMTCEGSFNTPITVWMSCCFFSILIQKYGWWLVNLVKQWWLKVILVSKISIFGNMWDSSCPNDWHVDLSPKQLLIWGRFVVFEWTLPLEFLLSAGSLQKHQGRWHRLAICTPFADLLLKWMIQWSPKVLSVLGYVFDVTSFVLMSRVRKRSVHNYKIIHN